MIDCKRWPGSLKDARPDNFKITKEDLIYMDQKPVTPEQYVNVIIKEWVESVTSELERSSKPQIWEQYPSYFGREIVYSNESFPTSLPIGFIIVSFLRSVYPTDCRLKEFKKILNYWLGYMDVRTALFNAHKKGKFYISEYNIDLRDAAEKNIQPELTGKDKADILYGAPQGSMFDSLSKG